LNKSRPLVGLPTLTWLRAFEAAARTSSFSAAALELRLTPGAISYQIRALEAHLGFALFERLPRGVKLTPMGVAYLPPVSRDELFGDGRGVAAALDLGAQIDLFRHARLIVAAHGGALANMLFCPPGAAVLELSPACEFRAHFCQLAGKLDLMHAVLPCQTVANDFQTAMQVPAPRLVVTLDVLQTRLALMDAAA